MVINMNYAEKLKDPRWQKKRLEVLERERWTCQVCGDKESTLNVHHNYYIIGKNPWEYRDGAFVVLCDLCHEKEKTERLLIEKYLLKSIRQVGFLNRDLLTLVDGFKGLGDIHEHKMFLCSVIGYFLSNKKLLKMVSDDQQKWLNDILGKSNA